MEPSYRVKPGDRFLLEIPEAIDAEPAGEDIPLAVVFEDDDLVVLDKPAGMVVHPAPGNPTGTLVNALIAHCGDGCGESAAYAARGSFTGWTRPRAG